MQKGLLYITNTDDMMNLPEHQLGLSLLKHRNIIYQKSKDSLYDFIMNDIGYNYWLLNQDRYTQENIPQINWEVQKKAIKATNTTQPRILSKWCSGWLGTGKNMKHWNLRYEGR